eukprot:2864122-Alexandrium_andersonii.AAC.1
MLRARVPEQTHQGWGAMGEWGAGPGPHPHTQARCLGWCGAHPHPRLCRWLPVPRRGGDAYQESF